MILETLAGISQVQGYGLTCRDYGYCGGRLGLWVRSEKSAPQALVLFRIGQVDDKKRMLGRVCGYRRKVHNLLDRVQKDL